MTALEFLLLLLFVGILLGVTSMSLLGVSVPHGASARDALFASSNVPPYRGIVSLRVGYLAPWIPAPDFAGCGAVARASFWFARIGAIVAVAALVGMIVLAFSGTQGQIA